MAEKKKILVVEDEAELLRLYEEKLTSEGYLTLKSTSIDRALMILKENKIDLILLDIMLPGGKNGFDFLEIIKRDPRYKSIPVIVMSNLDSEEKVALEIGANEYLIKANVSMDQLVSKVKTYISPVETVPDTH